MKNGERRLFNCTITNITKLEFFNLNLSYVEKYQLFAPLFHKITRVVKLQILYNLKLQIWIWHLCSCPAWFFFFQLKFKDFLLKNTKIIASVSWAVKSNICFFAVDTRHPFSGLNFRAEISKVLLSFNPISSFFNPAALATPISLSSLHLPSSLTTSSHHSHLAASPADETTLISPDLLISHLMLTLTRDREAY